MWGTCWDENASILAREDEGGQCKPHQAQRSWICYYHLSPNWLITAIHFRA
ncbi:hypothetical protein Mapa_002561 [Marchantia paleacea]|nr:hypothetical protein Mapa_002561 [Marchantia paleacea]